MPKRKQAIKQENQNEAPGLVADRPVSPGADYGVSKRDKGLLPWSYVSERMAEAKYYWISTVSPDQRPHATPVDGIWLDDHLYFGGSPKTRRNRNLVDNPAVCVHLESGLEVVILHGEAHELRNPDRSLAVRLSEASNQKYGYGTKPEDYESGAGGTFVFRPATVFAWRAHLKELTRWHIP